jgi:DDE superfamily endonuclease
MGKLIRAVLRGQDDGNIIPLPDHTSKELVVPEGIHLLFLPPYSPELQPCERLWPLSNEGVANQSFRTLDDLEAAQVQRCVVLQNQPEVIHSLTHFHWWPPSHSKHQ